MTSLYPNKDGPIFVITERRTCKKCNQKGITQHPDWAYFWSCHPNQRWAETYKEFKPNISKYINDWFYDHNIPLPPPPEYMACPNCDGMGFLEKEITLDTALLAIKKQKENK